jgi:hypothetical protein
MLPPGFDRGGLELAEEVESLLLAVCKPGGFEGLVEKARSQAGSSTQVSAPGVQVKQEGQGDAAAKPAQVGADAKQEQAANLPRIGGKGLDHSGITACGCSSSRPALLQLPYVHC